MAAQIYWQGGVAPEHLGAYLQQADVFVFPTYEDGWGTVVSEAMAFGKPVLCSTGAAVCELVQIGENGFRFDPHDPLEVAAQMAYCLDYPEQLTAMGERSRQIIAPHTPQTAAQAFVEMTYQILEP
jgi:glycosyltransferase involved in cell wall biosynthesis